MDDSVLRALERWPGVPSVFGWLRLDRRGEWRLRVPDAEPTRFERIGNAALRNFIARNYARDADGRWFFQNGPQRVYVGLDYTPRVWRLDGERLADHCGTAPEGALAAWLDDEGSLIFADARGPGVLDDRDLARAADLIGDSMISLGGRALPLGRIARADVARRFDFQLEPRP